MTIQAEISKEVSYQFECKKDALKQVQSGDVKVTFTINQIDMPPMLYSDMMGQRYIAVLVPLNDDETPREIPAVKMKASLETAGTSPQKAPEEPKNSSGRWEDLSYTQRAGIKCADPDFWRFLGVQNEYEAIQEVYKRCDVTSRREIIKGSQAGARFDAMMDNYFERLFKIKSDENWKNLEEYYTAR